MPRPTSFGRDTGLQLRMTLTMFLLGLLYVGLVVTMFAVGVNGVMIALIAGGLAVFQLFGSDNLALRPWAPATSSRTRRPSSTR
jgi:heat shock protein HtpX